MYRRRALPALDSRSTRPGDAPGYWVGWYCTQVSVKRTARGRRNGWRSTHAGLPRTATGQLTLHW